jgi:hypothetical protein
MSRYGYRHHYDERAFGSQKEPLEESVNSRFGKQINVGDPVVTFAQCGRATSVDEGTFKGIMRVETWYRKDPETPYTLQREQTYYIVERLSGKRTKLHYEQSLCHASITVKDLIGHTI